MLCDRTSRVDCSGLIIYSHLSYPILFIYPDNRTQGKTMPYGKTYPTSSSHPLSARRGAYPTPAETCPHINGAVWMAAIMQRTHARSLPGFPSLLWKGSVLACPRRQASFDRLLSVFYPITHLPLKPPCTRHYYMPLAATVCTPASAARVKSYS